MPEVLDAAVESLVRAAAHAAAIATGQPAPEPIAVPAPAGRSARLAERLGLDRDAIDFVWAVVARAIDPRLGAHLRAVFGSEARVGLSVAQHAAVRALPPERVRALLAALAPDRALRAHGIVVPHDPAVTVDVDTRWSAPARLWQFLAGADTLDPELATLGGIVELPDDVRLSDEQQDVTCMLRGVLDRAHATVLVLDGARGTGRRTAIALAAGRPAIHADFARCGVAEAERTLLALVREATLRDAIPICANLDALWAKLPQGDDALLPFVRVLERIDGTLAITTTSSRLDLKTPRAIARVRWPTPDHGTRRTLWQSALPALGDDELDLVAERYVLGAGGISSAARSAIRRARERDARDTGLVDIVAGVQDQMVEQLGELARRVEVTQTWSELVLPADTLDDVRALIGRVRHAHFVLERWGFRKKLARGTGVAALFSGPPGTGKTMVAGLIARELELELYQVDLSRIVSKWVGETEKQLAAVFDAAEAGHALLLFDEADALFAKRSADVKSAVDRYANLEVNYLLQRVESFGGVVILTTNLDTAIDPALRRRLASHVVFGAPELEERVRLWREMLATGAPTESDVDCEALADEFPEMTGANIRNAVLAAAFLAAEERAVIAHDHLVRAGRGEYRAMGRVLAKHAARRRA